MEINKRIQFMIDMITECVLKKFTGCLIIRIEFNQGGIRGAKWNEEKEIKFN